MDQKTDCRKAFSETLLQMARENQDFYVVTSDARGSATLKDFAKAYPRRLVECGIAEQNEIGVASGMALAGKTVYVAAPAPFLSGRGYEQIKLDAAYNRANVKICGVSGGFSYGTLGTSHHALQDIAAVRGLEGLTVLIPSDGIQTRWLTRQMAKTKGPVYMRMGRGQVSVLYEPGHSFEIGKAECLHEGTDLTILACGEMVAPALDAAKQLNREEIRARVLDMYSIKPFDKEAVIQAAEETGVLLTVEEHSIFGGLGSMVAEVVVENYPVPMRIMGVPDEHTYPGESPDVCLHYGLTAEGIAAEARKLLAKKR